MKLRKKAYILLNLLINRDNEFTNEVKMNIDSASLKSICGDSKEVVVYGLASCKYEEINYLLDSINYKSYIHNSFYKAFHYNTYPFKLIEPNYQYGTMDFLRSRCKAILADIILENYKRSLKNEPLIILLFCVNFQNKSKETAAVTVTVTGSGLHNCTL